LDAILYTDGSSDKDKNGGWGCCILTPSGLTELVGYAADTTNNRMELMAALEGLRATPEGSVVSIVSDSAYMINSLKKKWYEGWFATDADPNFPYKRPNLDLWRELVSEVEKRVVSFVKVKGHNGDKWNERADKLAMYARKGQQTFSHTYHSFDPPPLTVLAALRQVTM
jgi:ribonuclease HI